MKILIIRVGRTGDMVMLTPALIALFKKYPDAEFTLLTSLDGKRTLGDFSNRIGTFWVYNRENPFSFLSRRSIKKKVVDGQFAHIYCFEHNPSYPRLFEGVKSEIHTFWENMGEKHYCQLLLDVVSGKEEDNGAYHSVSLSVNDHAREKTIEALGNLGISKNTFLLALHPTFSGAEKRFRSTGDKKNKLWPPEYFGELSVRLGEYAKRKDCDLRILMNLMPDECDYGEEILQFAQGQVEIFCPKPNFQQYKAFLQRVDLLVTPDTGPMHIAAALGTKIIALFAGRSPENCGPFVPEAQVQIIRAEKTTQPELGIAAICVEDVYHACIKVMG